jgi:hypothetical protein
MTDDLLRAKLAVLEFDILEAAKTEPVKQLGVVSVGLDEKIRLAAALKRQLLQRSPSAPGGRVKGPVLELHPGHNQL